MEQQFCNTWNRRRGLISVLAGLLLLVSGCSAVSSGIASTSARGRTYYVAPSGTDALGAGSSSQPFKTVQYAADQAQAGDTVRIRKGVYYERFVRLSRGGTERAPITFRAERGAILDHGLRVPEWTPDGGSVYRGQPIFPSVDDRKEWTHMVVVAGQPLERVYARSDLTEGTFYVDTSSGAVYVWAFGGASPMSRETLVLNSKDDPVWYQPGIKVAPEAQNIVLDGLTIRGANTGIEAGVWQSPVTGRNLIVRNCRIEFNWNYALRFNWWSGGTVTGCEMRQNGLANWPRGRIERDDAGNVIRDGSGNPVRTNWPSTIIGWYTDDVLVQNSRVHDNHGEGIGPYEGTSNWLIRNNVAHDNWSANVYVDTSEGDMVVDRNFLYNDPNKYTESKTDPELPELWRQFAQADGVRIGNEIADLALNDDTPGVYNVAVTNNVIVGTGGGIFSFNYQDGPYFLKDSLIANNTLIDNLGLTLGFEGKALFIRRGENVRVANNIVVGNEARFEQGIGAGITVQNMLVQAADQVSSDGSAVTISGTVTGEPRFVGGDRFKPESYKVRANSPARDAGVTVNSVRWDYFGTFRPRGRAYDIGAFEYR